LIARAAAEQLGIPVDRRRIVLERPLKELGEHEVPVRVHRDVSATLRVVVARDS
jgi:large subunit ribosomal protein L9